MPILPHPRPAPPPLVATLVRDPWEGLPYAPPSAAATPVEQVCGHPQWDDVSSYVQESDGALWQCHTCHEVTEQPCCGRLDVVLIDLDHLIGHLVQLCDGPDPLPQHVTACRNCGRKLRSDR